MARKRNEFKAKFWTETGCTIESSGGIEPDVLEAASTLLLVGGASLRDPDTGKISPVDKARIAYVKAVAKDRARRKREAESKAIPSRRRIRRAA